MTQNSLSIYEKLSPFDEEKGELNVIIETPKDCRNKYAFDEKLGVFVLKGVLAAGHSFPYDFGFIPQTLGGDGDPLDVLVLMDEAAFAGCLVPSRLIGVIEAEQTERDGRKERNDRLIAVAADSHTHSDVKSINDLNETLVDQIEHFFVSYNQIKGKEFKPLGRFGARKAKELVMEAIALYNRKK
ncbi:MAG TPA: inorganic diphosphatase [Pyrinomonadaceae bacterium]|jgi:inorganic pyrophosphatase|nr:inorganic diphosphatase [Pyrinomonadaceae bacterium]